MSFFQPSFARGIGVLLTLTLDSSTASASSGRSIRRIIFRHLCTSWPEWHVGADDLCSQGKMIHIGSSSHINTLMHSTRPERGSRSAHFNPLLHPPPASVRHTRQTNKECDRRVLLKVKEKKKTEEQKVTFKKEKERKKKEDLQPLRRALQLRLMTLLPRRV